MRIVLLFCALLLLLTGCVTPIDHSSTHLVTLRFRTDFLDHKAEEAIHQIKINVRFASIHKINKLPSDWSSWAKNTSNHDGECFLGCAHDCFAVINIHTFDDAIYLRVSDNDRNKVKLKARVWITRGPLGPGRIVTLDEQQFILK
ncbi:MAG: hypothetical protein NTY53_11460 [Kiritimatiellaeota bacterium]|nr:hypothetical protein [Kiritimatiellota bacterium]